MIHRNRARTEACRQSLLHSRVSSGSFHQLSRDRPAGRLDRPRTLDPDRVSEWTSHCGRSCRSPFSRATFRLLLQSRTQKLCCPVCRSCKSDRPARRHWHRHRPVHRRARQGVVRRRATVSTGRSRSKSPFAAALATAASHGQMQCWRSSAAGASWLVREVCRTVVPS